MQPLSGTSQEGKACGHVVRDPMAQLHPPAHPTDLVADSALYSAENRQKLAATSRTWIPRVPATWHEAQAVLAQAAPQTMAPLTEGSRSHVVPSNYGGGAPRWVLIYAEPRQPPAQRTVDKQWRKQSDRAVQAFQTRCRTAFACAAEAHQALARFAHDGQTTFLSDRIVCPTPQDGKRGRPGPGAQPAQSVEHIAGALASRLTDARRVSTSRAVLSSRRTNWTRASGPPRRCSMDTKGKPKWKAGFASSQPRNFWPPRSSSKTPSASWPCGW